MSKPQFVGRSNELDLLDDLWASPSASLLILYGRRRVGKTRLLTHWLTQRHANKGIYWVAEPTSALDQLRSFSQALYNYQTPDEPAPLDFTYANWEQALRQVALMASAEKFILFIDELGYLIDVDPSIAGVLQKSWDRWLSKSKLILALSGSQMGLMQNMFTYEAPLYGRATAQVKLPPLPYAATHQFFPQYDTADRATLYGIWGGVPAYWERLDPNTTILENIRHQLLPSNTLMQEEPRILLQDFITDPHNYVGIMRAIAYGSQTHTRISTRTGLSRGHVSKYLSVLRQTGFVRREVPVTEDPSKSRRGHYHITDPFLRFYYRFVSAHQAQLALGEQQLILNTIEKSLPQFMEQNTWQHMCREWLLRASVHGDIPYMLDQVGGAWQRTVYIDVVGINREEHVLVMGSCHWHEGVESISRLSPVISKADSIVPNDMHRWKIYFVLFSANGWDDHAKEKGLTFMKQACRRKKWDATGIKLVDLQQVDADLTRWTIAAEMN